MSFYRYHQRRVRIRPIHQKASLMTLIINIKWRNRMLRNIDRQQMSFFLSLHAKTKTSPFYSWFQTFAVFCVLCVFFWVNVGVYNSDDGELSRRKHTTSPLYTVPYSDNNHFWIWEITVKFLDGFSLHSHKIYELINTDMRRLTIWHRSFTFKF